MESISIVLLEQHGIGERWIDMITHLNSILASRYNSVTFHAFAADDRIKQRIQDQCKLPNLKAYNIYENYSDKNLSDAEITYLKSKEDAIRVFDRNVNLARFLQPDIERNNAGFSTSENLNRILHWNIRYFDDFLKNTKVDYLIGFTPENISNYALYYNCKLHSVPVVFVEYSRLWRGIFFFDNAYAREDYLAPHYRGLIGKEMTPEERDRANTILSDYTKAGTSYYLQDIFKKARSKESSLFVILLKKLMIVPPVFTRNLLNTLTHLLKADKSVLSRFLKLSDYWIGFFRHVREPIVKYNLLNLFSYPIEGEDYFYFPLHYQPETSISYFAPHYMDQCELIRQLSMSLPVGCKLYVKEHPFIANIGYRPINFYRELSSIPNVRLIDLTLPSGQLIKNSKGVIVVTGTTALEGIFAGKPVMVLADTVSFSDIPELTVTPSGPNEFSEALRKMLDFKQNQDLILKFVLSYDKGLHGGLSLQPRQYWKSEEYNKNFRRIAELIAERILSITSL